MEITLEGVIRAEEMRQFIEQSLSLARPHVEQGRSILILADLRQLRTTAPEAAEILRQGQETAVKLGLKRIAEIVDSELTTLQLSRIARSSGMDSILRRFQTEEEARRWLHEGDNTLDAA